MPSFDFPIKRLKREMDWLLTEFSPAASGDHNRKNQLACEMAVIRLHDSWARFCREVVILSSLGNVVTVGGQALTRSHPDMIHRRVFTPVYLRIANANQEPRWADSTACIRAATRLSIQNLANVSLALGAANSPAETMRRVRNFYAHRGHKTADGAKTTPCFPLGKQPTVFHLNDYTAGGVTIFESWTQELFTVAAAAIQ